MASQSFDTTHITDELPDSFFDVTVDDCVAMQRDLHQKVKKLTNAPLTTASLREAALYQRYSRYNKVRIVAKPGCQAIHPGYSTCTVPRPLGVTRIIQTPGVM